MFSALKCIPINRSVVKNDVASIFTVTHLSGAASDPIKHIQWRPPLIINRLAFAQYRGHFPDSTLSVKRLIHVSVITHGT